MADFSIHNQGISQVGGDLYTYAGRINGKPASAGKAAAQEPEAQPSEKLELSEDIEEPEEETGEHNPLLSALKGEQSTQEGAAGKGTEGTDDAPENGDSDISGSATSAQEPASDPFTGGETNPSLVRSTQVPDSFVSNTGVDTPGDASGNTTPSLTVDLGDPEVAKAQVNQEITNQSLAQDQSKQAQEQSGSAGAKIQGEVARHRSDQANIGELQKNKQADAAQGQEQVEAEKQQIDQYSDSIGQVQQAGNDRASQVGQMQSGLASDQQAVDDAAESINSARESEDSAQSTLNAAQQKLNESPPENQSGHAASGGSAKSGKPQEGGKAQENGKGEGNQGKEAQQQAQQQAQSQYQQAQQKLTAAQQQVQQAEQKQSKAEQKLQQDQTTVDNARKGLEDYSKVLDNGVKARRASEDQMAGDLKTLQDDQDGVRHLANRSREISGFIEQNQDALVTTGKVEQISQNNVKDAGQNIQQLTSILPQLGARQPGEGEPGDDLAAQEKARERVKAGMGDKPQASGQGASHASAANSAGIDAANAAGVTPAANLGSTKSTQRGDKLTIDLITLKNAAAEVASDSMAGGGRNQSYVGGVDDLGGADIAAPEGNSGNSSSSPAINESSGSESTISSGGDGHQDHGNGKSSSAPGHNKQ